MSIFRLSTTAVLVALATHAHAGPALSTAKLAPACKAITADPSSPHARAMFDKLPRKPKQKAKLVVQCGSECAALFVMTYARQEDAAAQAHVLGDYLAGPGAGDPHADTLLTSDKTVVVLSPASPAAIKALADLGYVAHAPSPGASTAGKTIEQLIDVFRGSDYDAMDGAIAELTKHGAAAVPALTRAIADAKPMVRSQSAAVLGRIGKPAAPAVPGLIKLLSDADPDNRWNAANALGAIGPDARAALPALKQLMSDKIPPVAQAAADAHAKIAAK